MQADILLLNGMIYDGLGGKPYPGGLAVQGENIAALGDVSGWSARQVIDLNGLALAPGFINMLSWASETLIADGRSQGDLRQGVTLEVMGEGFSFGPLNPELRAELKRTQGDIQYDIEWTSLGEYLEFLEGRGVSTNVASFVGGGTLRAYTMGYANRAATPEELELMQALLAQAMQEGAVGLSAALIYVPDCFYRTDELVALARTAAEFGGMYISHIRNEAEMLLEAVDELIGIARQTGIRAEFYHLKASGEHNWGKMDSVFERIEAARAEGLSITADMYTYSACATGLDAAMPHWVQEGGHQAWVARLRDPAIRQRVIAEMRVPSLEWENSYLNAGSPENVLFVDFKTPALKPLTGKTLAEVAALRGASPEDVMIDLVIEDDSRIGTVYFSMSEDNLRKQVRQPWMSFCSDAGSMAPEGVFLKSSTHPRAYGSFARLLARYVRDENLITVEEAVRRLTSLPAHNLRLKGRGRLSPGYAADMVAFDPETIQDHATFHQPHQYATGVQHVLVNGVPVIQDGEHTGAMPGQVVRGPGWKGE